MQTFSYIGMWRPPWNMHRSPRTLSFRVTYAPGSFSFFWSQFKYYYLRVIIFMDHPWHFSSFPAPPVLYHVAGSYLLYFLFTSPSSPLLLFIHLSEYCLYPLYQNKAPWEQEPCLANKQKGISNTSTGFTKVEDHLISTDIESVR